MITKSLDERRAISRGEPIARAVKFFQKKDFISADSPLKCGDLLFDCRIDAIVFQHADEEPYIDFISFKDWYLITPGAAVRAFKLDQIDLKFGHRFLYEELLAAAEAEVLRQAKNVLDEQWTIYSPENL